MTNNVPYYARCGAAMVAVFCILGLVAPMIVGTFSWLSTGLAAVWLICASRLMYLNDRCRGDPTWSLMEDQRSSCNSAFTVVAYELCAILLTAPFVVCYVVYPDYAWYVVMLPFVNSACLLMINHLEDPSILFWLRPRVLDLDLGAPLIDAGAIKFRDRTNGFAFTRAINAACFKDSICICIPSTTQMTIRGVDPILLLAAM